ncbi:MAG TPA: serine/threonine-protein kinase [Thermoanaerobaculia bacterium]
MSQAARIDELLNLYMQHRANGQPVSIETLCGDSDLAELLRDRVGEMERNDPTVSHPSDEHPATHRDELPQFTGFRTIERLGKGGGGEVFKLYDLELQRQVAGKIIRQDHSISMKLDSFIREAKVLALFDDPRIVRILDFRRNADPPFIVMEFVDGFELSKIGPSLSFAQRARIILEVADAIHKAHLAGVQHRDLKPGNILLDQHLSPRILDFGISSGDPGSGHFAGTPAYMAPEQFDSALPIDERTDVYALGVILYELLCGSLPYSGRTVPEIAAAICGVDPQLPVEINSTVPEPLQAIALKAMERDPEDRYPTAAEMATDLARYLEGRPILTRPAMYRSALAKRIEPHLAQIQEWLRIKLIYPHELETLTVTYNKLTAREEDWIVESRILSYSSIALYLGAFLLFTGSGFYFVAYRLESFAGLLGPAIRLLLPFAVLTFVAQLLYAREQRGVAVAFHLAALILLPMFALIFLEEVGLFAANRENPREFFGGEHLSNRQLQVSSALPFIWAYVLALKTRTKAFGTAFTTMSFLLAFSILTDFGLKNWLDANRFDVLSFHLTPFVGLLMLGGWYLDRRERPWMSLPLYFGGAGLFVAVLELLALDGKAFEYLGLSMGALQPATVSSPLLLDTLAAMTVNGVVIYVVAGILDRFGTELMQRVSWFLYTVSPFVMLEPLFRVSQVGEYSRRFDWFYLVLALTIALLSHHRQRKSFYYAGLINTGLALLLITDHYDLWDSWQWATAVMAVGLTVLMAGYALDVRERYRSPEGSRAQAVVDESSSRGTHRLTIR